MAVNQTEFMAQLTAYQATVQTVFDNTVTFISDVQKTLSALDAKIAALQQSGTPDLTDASNLIKDLAQKATDLLPQIQNEDAAVKVEGQQ